MEDLPLEIKEIILTDNFRTFQTLRFVNKEFYFLSQSNFALKKMLSRPFLKQIDENYIFSGGNQKVIEGMFQMYSRVNLRHGYYLMREFLYTEELYIAESETQALFAFCDLNGRIPLEIDRHKDLLEGLTVLEFVEKIVEYLKEIYLNDKVVLIDLTESDFDSVKEFLS